MEIIKRAALTEAGQGYAAKHFDIVLQPKEYPSLGELVTVVGIDPGTRHFGLAILHEDRGSAFDVTLPPSQNRIENMQKIQECIRDLLDQYWKVGLSKDKWVVYIEDASFSMPFGQVQLAEGRAAAALYFAPTCTVTLVPPLKIRKMVFGDGKKHAEKVWPISPNAGAALSCAVYGLFDCGAL